MARPTCRGRAPRRSRGRARCRRCRKCGPLLLLLSVAVAFDGASATDHHLAVLFLGHARHAAGHLLKTLAIGRADFREEIDVAAKRNAAIEVPREHGLLL